MSTAKKLIFVFVLIIFIYSVTASPTWNYLTKGRADTLYCSIIDGCNSGDNSQKDMSFNLESVIDNEDINLNMTNETNDYKIKVRAGRIFYFKGGDMLD